MNKVFGVISWLPDDSRRSDRINNFNKLLIKIDEVFPTDIPMIIIAQNWKDFKPESKRPLIIYKYDKLGITPARKKLRTKFLNSKFDYLIMLDDDCVITGNDSNQYLAEIDSNENGVCWFSDHLLKLFAISKSAYRELDLPNVNAEKCEAFEDRLYITMCREYFKDRCIAFTHSDKLNEISYEIHDASSPSLWWNVDSALNRQKMIDNTDRLIDYFIKTGKVNLDLLKKNSNIDIVVTYVNNQDEDWQKEYTYWKNKENIDETNEQLNSEIRFRDTETFKYFFRSIENSCAWVNNVFLIVQNEKQVPDWINRDNVKIIYHEQFIPQELLPTFNSNTIEFYLSNIKELSDNYILCNDDTFFLNKVNEDKFFLNNKPVYEIEYSGARNRTDIFNSTLVNNQKVLNAIFNKDDWYVHRHQATPHKKSWEQQLIVPNKELFENGFNKSKFRHESNYTPWLFNEFAKMGNLGVNVPGLYKKAQLVELNSKLNLNNYDNLELICLNDTARNDNFEVTKKMMQEFLDKHFPNKCKYEV